MDLSLLSRKSLAGSASIEKHYASYTRTSFGNSTDESETIMNLFSSEIERISNLNRDQALEQAQRSTFVQTFHLLRYYQFPSLPKLLHLQPGAPLLLLNLFQLPLNL